MVVSLREIVMSHEKIYSLLYSPCRIESDPLEKQITEISTESLRWSDDGTMFVYVWGWPGPDFNRYSAKTYGKGWAFTKQEIIDAWESENRK